MPRHLREKFYKLFNEKHALPRYVARRFLFNFFQSLGLHVTGDHFYELVPNTRFVAQSYSDDPRAIGGVDWRRQESELEALRLLKAHGKEYGPEVCKYGFREPNAYFCGIDALMLYLILRDLKPKKMVEVGQGFSTRVALAALERNVQETGSECEFISIDPYARIAPEQFPKGLKSRFIREEFQTVALEPLLENCDFLFVDSSHVYKFGSDVEFEFNRVYPALRPGTMLHVHDIFAPYNYPRNWIVQEKQFWNEQYFLETFLMFNREFEVHLPMHMLLRQSDEFSKQLQALPLLPEFDMRANSFYLRRR